MANEVLTDEEVNEILTKFEGEATQDDENLLLWIALGVGFDISIFATRIEREIAVLRAAGTSDEAIRGILRADLQSGGRIFGELRNSIKRGVVLGIMQSSRLGQAAIYGDSVELFRWVNVEGNRVCGDCLGRAGDSDSWAGWESRGMPGSGWSVCGSSCYCVLVPDGIEISDTVKRG